MLIWNKLPSKLFNYKGGCELTFLLYIAAILKELNTEKEKQIYKLRPLKLLTDDTKFLNLNFFCGKDDTMFYIIEFPMLMDATSKMKQDLLILDWLWQNIN